MTVLVTGVAGFIGMHVVRALSERGDRVLGIDNLNDYYDVALKHARLAQLLNKNFEFLNKDVRDAEALLSLIRSHQETSSVAAHRPVEKCKQH